MPQINIVENLTDEQSYIKDRLEELRKKLVDVSGRTNLISFRHSERVHSHVRIIDEIPDQLLERIKTSKGMTFVHLPDQDNVPKDEKTPEFQDAYAYIKIEDEYFISEFKKLVDGDISEDSPKYLTLDRELKDKARDFLDMSVIPNRYTMSKDEYATLKGFSPSYELPKPDLKDRSKAHSDDNIQTLLFDDELNRKLNGLYKKAKLFEQEYQIQD